MSDQIKIGQTMAHYNATGNRILKYSVELYHNGLSEHKVISAPDTGILRNKANLQIIKWDKKWSIIKNKREELLNKEANKDEAKRLTEEANARIDEIGEILEYTLDHICPK